MLVAGPLAISVPLVAGVAVAALVAWLLIVSGLFHFAFAWSSPAAGAFIWEFLLGLAYFTIGVYILAHPLAGLASLTLAAAIYLFVEGVLEFTLWFQLRTTPGKAWLLLDGIVTLILAAMIWRTWPSSAAWVVGTLVGVSMFFSGISRFVLSLAVRRRTE